MAEKMKQILVWFNLSQINWCIYTPCYG